MDRSEFERTARAMVAKGQGILAADESSGTIKNTPGAIKLEFTEEAPRTYREFLFTTRPIAKYINGVTLYDETIRQKRKEGVTFAQHLTKLGIVPGIKADMKANLLATFPNETITDEPGGLLTFSHGHARHDEALQACGGKPEGFVAGQKAFAHRAQFNGLGTTGSYTSKHEQEAA
jgi:fructose-bisphosphate aldolase class 1